MSNPSANLPGFAPPVAPLKSILKSKSTIAVKEQAKKETDTKVKGWFGGDKKKPKLNNNPAVPLQATTQERAESATHAYAAASPLPQRPLAPPKAPAAPPAVAGQLAMASFKLPEPAMDASTGRDDNDDNNYKRAATVDDAITTVETLFGTEHFTAPAPDIALNIPRKRPSTVVAAAALGEEQVEDCKPHAMEEEDTKPHAIMQDSQQQRLGSPTRVPLSSTTTPTKNTIRDIVLGKREKLPVIALATSDQQQIETQGGGSPRSGMRFRRVPKKTASGNPPPKMVPTTAAAVTNKPVAAKNASKRGPNNTTGTATPKNNRPKKKARVQDADDSAEAVQLLAAEAVGASSKTKKTKKTAKTEPKAKPAEETPPPRKTAAPRTGALEIFSGVPDEVVAGVDWTGWTKKTFRRMSGKTAGSTDSYWYTPQTNKKLRSIQEVKRFMGFMAEVGNDEELSWKRLKGKA